MTNPAISLYRELFRKTRLLPRSAVSYYRRHIKENFVAFSDEDPERVEQLIAKAGQDADWVVQKYSKPKNLLLGSVLDNSMATAAASSVRGEGAPLLEKGHSLENGTRESGGKPETEPVAGGWLGRELWMAIASISLWMFSSSALIFINRHLMVDEGFRYPLALTGLGQWASWLAGFLLIQSGCVSARGAPSARTYMTRLVPIVLCSAGSLGFGNAAYLTLSISFVQILKVLVPAFTFAACVMLKLEKLRVDLTMAVLLIAGGTGITTVVESGTAGFSWVGFSVMTLSVFLEALRVVFMQVLMGQLSYSPMEVLVYLGPPIGAVLVGSSLIWERAGIFAGGGLRIIARVPFKFLVSAFMGFFVNLSTAWAIQTTSSLTFKVFGCVKNTVVVWAGVLMGDHIDATQVVGYGISVLGFALYTYAKMQPVGPVSGPPPIKKNR